MMGWFKSFTIDLEEETLFTGTVYIPVTQLGIAQVVVVKTKSNGGL